MNISNILSFFKYDPATQGALTFNIEQALNENWDKILVMLAKVLMKYDASITYAENDLCTSGGKIYLSKADSNVGNALTNTTYWKDINNAADTTITTALATALGCSANVEAALSALNASLSAVEAQVSAKSHDIDTIRGIDAQQNIAIWQLQADTIQSKEDFNNWQGDGFFVNQDEISITDTMAIKRGILESEGYGICGAALGIADERLSLITTPPAIATGVDFSSDGNYLAVAHSTTPYVTIYKRNGDVFTKLANPSVLPNGDGYAVKFSPDGMHLFVGHLNSYLSIYKRDGDVFNKITSTISSLSNTISSISFTADGTLVALCNGNSAFLYKRSGNTDTYTQIELPPIGANCRSVALSPEGNYLAINKISSPYIIILKRTPNTDAFVQLPNPAYIPTDYSYGAWQEICFSNNGKYLATLVGVSPFVIIYKRDGDVFTKLANPSVLPLTAPQSISFSKDDRYLVVGETNAPGITIYKRDGDVFTKVTSHSVPTNAVAIRGISFSGNDNDDYYMALTSSPSPYLYIFKSQLSLPLTGSLTLKTITLTQSCNSVFIMDDVLQEAGVSRHYEVSLNGGTTFETVSTTGELVKLNHSGTQMIIKFVYNRDVIGVGKGKVYWLIAWGGVS